MTPEVRAATDEDIEHLGLVLGRAFEDDPIWLWVYPQGNRVPRLARMFTALLRSTMAGGATVLTDTERRGAAIWQRHDARSIGVIGNVRMGTTMIRTGARMRRGMAMLRATERVHPKAPHWYLAVLGTDPVHQGSGVGSALIRHVVDDPDHVDDAAYLETETEGNVAYYLRHGFEVTGEADVGTDGPHLWFMWRDPRPPGTDGTS